MGAAGVGWVAWRIGLACGAAVTSVRIVAASVLVVRITVIACRLRETRIHELSEFGAGPDGIGYR
jgi:hypothetical protein